MPSSCCIKGCSNKQTFYGYSMFGFPNDPDARDQWVKAVSSAGSEPKSHSRVCEVHFEPTLVHFVGSRKELMRNAVPTLFCNCTQSSSIAQAKESSDLDTKEEPPSTSKLTSLDHSYSQNTVLTDRVKKEKNCNDTLHRETYKKRKSWKHDSDCNLMREPLKNIKKLKDQDGDESSTPSFLPTLQPKKVKSAVLYHSVNVFKKIDTAKTKPVAQSKLKSQLQSALDENAKLKRELSVFKGLMLPVKVMPSNRVKFLELGKLVQLKKVV